MGVVGDIQLFRTDLPLPERPSIRCLAATAKGMVTARPRAGPRRWVRDWGTGAVDVLAGGAPTGAGVDASNRAGVAVQARAEPAPNAATLSAHQPAISGVTNSKLVFPLERTQGMRLPRSFGSGSAQARSPLLWHGATLSDRPQGEAWR
jgi:hypothetical protein